MATRSHIIVEIAPQEWRVIYCHSDGYPSFNGVMLDRFHNTQDGAAELVANGDTSSLNVRRSPEPGEPHEFGKAAAFCTVVYGRDRGDKDSKAREFHSLELALRAADEEFVYVRHLNADGWLFGVPKFLDGVPVTTPDDLKPLAPYLAEDEECRERIAKLHDDAQTVEWRDAGCPHSAYEGRYGTTYLPVALNEDGSIPATATFGKVWGSGDEEVGELPVYTVGLYESAPAPAPKKRNVAKKADKRGFAYQEGAWA